jgi:hypothetical protein
MPDLHRKLAAIMPARRSFCEGGFTDIVGYAALTYGDADRAIEMLCRHREILRPAIDKHKGWYLEESDYKLPTNFHKALTF